MKTKINVIKKESPKTVYPEVPFMTSDAGTFMIIQDLVTNQYRILDISSGRLFSNAYNTLKEYFEDNNLAKVVESEITVKL